MTAFGWLAAAFAVIIAVGSIAAVISDALTRGRRQS